MPSTSRVNFYSMKLMWLSCRPFQNYRLIFERSFGVRFETYPTFRDGGYNVTGCLDAVKKNEGKRVLVILNFPHNPTGYACSQQGR